MKILTFHSIGNDVPRSRFEELMLNGPRWEASSVQ
jgi:hypothetical protein